jgi:hypothetical protein
MAHTFGLHDHGASFDKLRMRNSFCGTKKKPHPELVEGRNDVDPSLLLTKAG